MEKERIVLVTGGTRGIGLETARRFLKAGDKVVVGSIDDAQTVQSAMKELETFGEVCFFPLDVASEHSCKEFVTAAAEKYGRIDILCNVAGMVENISPILELDMAAAERTIQVNLMGSIYMAIHSAREMAKQKQGVIINVSSICAYLAGNANVGYHASKGGVTAATRVLALELAQYGIRCVAVAPGFVRTRLFDPSTEDRTRMCQMKGRMIEPEEIAGAIYLMSLEDASAINGTTIMAEDGQYSKYGDAHVSC